MEKIEDAYSLGASNINCLRLSTLLIDASHAAACIKWCHTCKQAVFHLAIHNCHLPSTQHLPHAFVHHLIIHSAHPHIIPLLSDVETRDMKTS